MSKIEIIGLGAGDLEQLPLGIYRQLKQTNDIVFARTENHPVIDSLIAEGIRFHFFDNIYEQYDDFEEVYKTIVKKILKQAKDSPVIYAVPGHPMMAEKTVQLLIEQQDVPVNIVGGQSFLDDVFTMLQIDPIDGFQLIDGTSIERNVVHYDQHLLLGQIYDQFVASEVKLTLLEDLPADYEITLLYNVGSSEASKKTIPLFELDRQVSIDNRLTVYVPPAPKSLLHHTFSRLREVIAQLRGENGCQWDREQTHESLRQYLIEETYELIDAINEQDDEAIVEELGDVLLQVMLHSQIGEDNGYFTINDVIKKVTDKMIHRHPHVYLKNTVNKTWDELKAEERGSDMKNSILDSVTQHAPSLHVAYDIQKMVAKVGFEWENIHGVWQKYDEELSELKEAINREDNDAMEAELGDVLFVLANIAKWYQINPEMALRRTLTKFTNRFHYVEARVNESGKDFSEYTLEQLDKFWDEKKKMERS